MSDTIVLGKAGAIEQPKRYSGGPFKPTNVTRTWKGPKAAIKAMLATIVLYDWDMIEEGPNATLSVSIPFSDAGGGGPGTEVPIDTWELAPGVVEKDILQADIALCAGFIDKDIQGIRNAVADTGTTLKTSPFDTGSNKDKLYQLMIKNVSAVRVFAPTLKRTRTVTNRYAVPQAEKNVGKIIKNATLIGPTTVLGSESLPDGFLIALGGDPFTKTSTHSNLTYGWLKDAPALQVASNSRLQITQEWQFGLWATDIYGAAI